MMKDLFLILFLLSIIILVLGLISPSIFIKIFKKNLARKQVFIYFGSAVLIFFILFGIFSDKSNPSAVNQVAKEQEQQINNITKESNQPAEIKSEEIKGEEIEEIQTYLVVKVIDGDTIEIEGGQKVRYISIDTPETVHPSQPIECFGKEASDKNKELVEGKRIRLEKDVSETDRYGRLLRYVWIDNIFVNDYLVRQGYANTSTYPPDVKYSEQFTEAQKEARENNRGLWKECESSSPVSTPTPEPTPQPSSNTNNIICSYNAYNCSDFSTYAEAKNAYDICGGVGNDIHKLDADKDGIPCESLS